MRHKARTSPETLRSAAIRIDSCIRDLQNNQLRLKTSVREVGESWKDSQSRHAIEKVEKLIELVERQIRENEEMSNKLKRKADRLSEYLGHRIR